MSQAENATPKGSRAVMNRRLDPTDSLDFFPTPPWATRVLRHYVIPDAEGIAVDPCAGEGHMAEVLREQFDGVYASDIHDYGVGYAVGSFAGKSDMPQTPIRYEQRPDWFVFNPPFNLAVEFVFRALSESRRGVAALVRSNWAEGGDRYRDLFSKNPPSLIAQFAERVPMVKGYWDPEGSTATSYAWFVWDRAASVGTKFVWIPPGCRTALERPDDRRRFAAWYFEPLANADEIEFARALRRQAMTPREMIETMAVSKDRLTRILHDLKDADAKLKKAQEAVAA